MSGRWDDNTLNCDFKSIHCKLDNFERDLQTAAEHASKSDPRDCDMSVENMLVEKRSLEDRIDLLQRELDALDYEGDDGTSSRGRDPYRTSSPGELSKVKERTKAYQSLGRSSQPRRSASTGCRCRCSCNTFFSDSKAASNPERDSQLHELRQELREVNVQKQTLQEKIFSLEEAQRLTDNDTQMLQSQLEADRVRCRQMEEENEELKEEIQRLETALNNLPVGDGGATRDTAAQITQLLQTLNDDMVKAPELCNRLRMAAQQIMDGEKRLTNERSTRAMDQAEVQYLRTENQRLRELAFRANMSAFQASVQLPQNQMGFQQQMMTPGAPFGPGGACVDPYAQQQVRRKSMFQRVFGKNTAEDMGPGTLQYQDGSRAQFDPMMSMQQQRLSLAMQEDPDEAARRLQLLNQEKTGKGCCRR
ncbi:uncharacterized protein LOC119109050 [Pollicipes pollicipes]|uniref:uncharacterized protein LOC119109050 n=1 Tax=Pollicipes pollicipes TaxID=41117 RepID=UPI00188571F0|nr:uncharacterized protein LOC119109050 [Pollicipes pollicipes]